MMRWNVGTTCYCLGLVVGIFVGWLLWGAA